MKKIVSLILSFCLLLALAACTPAAKPDASQAEDKSTAKADASAVPAESSTEASEKADSESQSPAAGEGSLTTLRFGATPSPHAEIAEALKDELAKEGIRLEIKVFTDYITPNHALADGDIDVNFFQHIPYLEDFAKSNKLKLENLGPVHIEPMGVFSDKLKSLDELKGGDEILIPNDPTNAGRALLLLQSQGLIKLKDGGSVESTEADVAENPKNLKFTALEASLLPQSLPDAAAAVINGNYAIQNGLDPIKDSIAIEGKDSPYVNVLAVREGEASKEIYQKLLKVFQSEAARKFIEEKYNGSVVPAF